MTITSLSTSVDSIARIKALRATSAIAILILTFCMGLLISYSFSGNALIRSSSVKLILMLAGSFVFFAITLFSSHRAIEATPRKSFELSSIIPQWMIIFYSIFMCFVMAWPQ